MLENLPGWQLQNQKLCKEFTCKNFSSAFAFLSMVALLAEKQNHHPDFYMSYNKIRFELSSHDAGNIATERDYVLAKGIEKKYAALTHE